MKTDEKIIKYLSNELSVGERATFEAELEKSSQLRQEYEHYLYVDRELKFSKYARLNQNYLNTILYEFQNSRKRSKPVFEKAKLGYAFAILVAFFVSTLLFTNIFWQKNEMDSLQQFTESLNENQKIELLENINGDLEDYILLTNNDGEMDLTDLLQSELKINNEIAEAYDISYTELVDELSPVEADKIYNEILNKNFSDEVNL